MKQQKYPVYLFAPILFKSVDRLMNDGLNDPCRICNLIIFTDSTNYKQNYCRLFMKMYKTTNLQVNKLYTFL